MPYNTLTCWWTFCTGSTGQKQKGRVCHNLTKFVKSQQYTEDYCKIQMVISRYDSISDGFQRKWAHFRVCTIILLQYKCHFDIKCFTNSLSCFFLPGSSRPYINMAFEISLDVWFLMSEGGFNEKKITLALIPSVLPGRLCWCAAGGV